MTETLSIFNYTHNGKCHCDGHATDKYINGEYEVRVRTRAQMFKIKHRGSSITTWINIRELKTKLSEFHPQAVQA